MDQLYQLAIVLALGAVSLIGFELEYRRRRRRLDRIIIEPVNEYATFKAGYHYYFNMWSHSRTKLPWKMRIWRAYIRFMDWLAERLHRLLGSPEPWELWL